MNAPTFLVVAGDPSGDLHAANLISALKRLEPSARVSAVGGPLCRTAADEFIEDLASRGVTGFWEPALKLNSLLKLRSRLGAFLHERRPAALICVDYYGFNRLILPLAKSAGVPAFYFVSPQVWASRPNRIFVLKRFVREMLVIFPFEEKIYSDAGVPVKFVGHPLLDLVPEPPKKEAADPAPIVGLLPGSRSSELQRHLPVFYDAFRLLRKDRPSLRGLLFASKNQTDDSYGHLPEGVALIREQNYARRAELDLALCSSGTATLENALLGVPMVVVYKLSWPTYAIARALINVSHIAMANLLAGRTIVPELIQSAATPERVAVEAAKFLDDPVHSANTRTALLELRSHLGKAGACDRAAATILSETKSG